MENHRNNENHAKLIEADAEVHALYILFQSEFDSPKPLFISNSSEAKSSSTRHESLLA